MFGFIQKRLRPIDHIDVNKYLRLMLEIVDDKVLSAFTVVASEMIDLTTDCACAAASSVRNLNIDKHTHTQKIWN